MSNVKLFGKDRKGPVRGKAKPKKAIGRPRKKPDTKAKPEKKVLTTKPKK